MKKIILFLVSITYTICANSQIIQHLYPREGKVFTDKAAADFKRGKELAEKQGSTEKDREIAASLGYDEMYESYWDLIGEGCSWYCEGKAEVTKASSSLKSQGSNTYFASNVGDLNAYTAWVEGVKGYGIGEWIEFNIPGPRITNVCIVNGYVKSEKAWKNNSRVKQLKVYLNDKPFAIFDLKDKRCEQWFDLDNPFRGKIKFEILDVYKGDLYDDTAISEIYFNGIDVH